MIKREKPGQTDNKQGDLRSQSKLVLPFAISQNCLEANISILGHISKQILSKKGKLFPQFARITQ